MTVHEPEHDRGTDGEPTIPGTAGTAPVSSRRPRRGDPVGWYADPDQPSMARLWAGETWASDGAGGPLRRSREPTRPFPASVNAAYLLGVVLPLLAAVVLPIPVMNATAPPHGVGSLAAWESSIWSGIAVGWGLWLVGVVLWQVFENRFEDQAVGSYAAAASWHTSLKVLVILVTIVAVLGTLGSFLLLAFTAALGGVGNSL